ncbi:MAG: PepSY-like domain-containing protein [Tannerellaceae bacterium]|jgi:hypothetical protein|nr:PepSY-like domain-containing protein [Tannerellaceae bacterium]
MKTRICQTIIAIIAAILISSCSSQEEDIDGGGTSTALVPGEQVLHTFNADYPNATNTLWSIRRDYFVADFTAGANQYRTWFTKEGVRVVEKKYITYGDLDSKVIDAFMRTNYASWDIRKTYQLARRNFATISGISVILNGRISNLYFTMNGDYIRVADDFSEYSDAPINVPQALQTEINDMFDQPTIVDLAFVDVVNSEISVGLITDEHFITAFFTKDFYWIVNFWEVSLSELPEAVQNGYLNSRYSQLPLIHIRIMESPGYSSYLFYVVRDGKTVIIEFNAAGQATTELSRQHVMTKYLLTR